MLRFVREHPDATVALLLWAAIAAVVVWARLQGGL